MQRYYLFIGLMLSVFVHAGAQQPLLKLVPSSQSGVNFRNDITETPDMFLYKYENLYIGSGVSVGDINNDGLADIYFGSSLGKNKLYLNQGNFTFRDITATAGVAAENGVKSGVNMVDINNDGFIDIFVCASGYKDAEQRRKHLYINNGDLTFTDRIKEYGLDDRSYSTQSYFFDYDLDGDKDLYLLNHPIDFSRSMTIPATMVNGKLVYVNDTSNTKYISDRLFENTGKSFKDVTEKAGIINHSFGLSTSIGDLNEDGWPDVYVANDFNKPDCIYINNKNGTFTNRLADYVQHVSFSAMGSEISDYNNDGLEDIFVMDMAVRNPVRQKQLFAVNQNYDKFQLLLKFDLFYQYPRNTLQLNNGNGTYSEIGNYAGVAETEWSWSPLFTDLDNDGYKDLYVTNGLKRDMTDWDYKVFILDSIIQVMNTGKNVDLNLWLQSMPSVPVKNYIFKNNRTLKFDDVTNNWTDAPASFSNGAAYADLDNDGDLDMIVNNIDGEAFILENTSKKQNHFLRLKFFEAPESNNEMYGTTVTLKDAKGNIQMQRYNPQRGFLSSSEHVMHFGLGENKSIASLVATFPGGKSVTMQNVKADSTLTLYLSEATSPSWEKPKTSTYFTSNKLPDEIKYIQKENDFIDFKREPLIPYKCSRKGPYYSKADVNKDGFEDIFISGSAGVAGSLFLQNSTGIFTLKTTPDFIIDKGREDMGSVFFDADGDGDMDLYVVSGGAEFPAGSPMYQDRLYSNDGLGNFKKSATALPALFTNGSVVMPFDYDNDNDLDLLIGGHVLPGSFPKNDHTSLLQNEAGKFTDVTITVAPELSSVGIINQLAWADTDADSKKELWVSGEWMAPKKFEWVDNKFTPVNTSLTYTLESGRDTIINMKDFTGWWYNMQFADLDDDGDNDILLANRGLNSSIRSAPGEPCTVYAKDFDKNGSYDAVLGYYNEEKLYPLFSRDQLIDQLPSMRKKFTRYHQYSGKTLDEIFTPAEKVGMDTFYTRFFESGILRNEGKDQYRFIPFPDKAQFSNINDLLVDDFTGNGKKDILACGNSQDPAVMVGVYDATPIILLQNTGNCHFTAVPMSASGLQQKGEIRKMIQLSGNQNKNSIILLKNDGPAEVIYSKY